jgi:hypothetical protein
VNIPTLTPAQPYPQFIFLLLSSRSFFTNLIVANNNNYCYYYKAGLLAQPEPGADEAAILGAFPPLQRPLQVF